VDKSNLLGKVTGWIEHVRRTPHPSIDVGIVLDMCQGDKETMVKMLVNFVHMTAQQIGALHNGLISQDLSNLVSITQAIMSVSERFGTPWLARAAKTCHRVLNETIAESQLPLASSAILRSIAVVEEELLIIGRSVAQMKRALGMDKNDQLAGGDGLSNILADLAAGAVGGDASSRNWRDARSWRDDQPSSASVSASASTTSQTPDTGRDSTTSQTPDNGRESPSF